VANLPLGAVAASVFDLITDRKRQERRIMADGNTPVNSGGVAQDQLRSVVERIERLEEEKAATMADIKEVYAEAKANGFDKQDKAERQEQEAILDLYLHALGMSE
jgi:uncharacterized protein (UPF0335 family)